MRPIPVALAACLCLSSGTAIVCLLSFHPRTAVVSETPGHYWPAEPRSEPHAHELHWFDPLFIRADAEAFRIGTHANATRDVSASRDVRQVSPFFITPGLEERGITVMGVNSANDIVDGPIQNDGGQEERTADGESLKYLTKHAERLANGRSVIFDASEGTPIDPLVDKKWDLNSAKMVPGPKKR